MIRTTLTMLLAIMMFVNTQSPTEVATLDQSYWAVDKGAYKCYMDYRTITDTSSPQWQLQQVAYTDTDGLRRVNNRFCIALGSAYGSTIGDKYIVELAAGAQLRCILADQKADCDTNADNTADVNGAVVEFIVDTPSLSSTVRSMGDVSYVEGFKGKVKRIYREE